MVGLPIDYERFGGGEPSENLNQGDRIRIGYFHQNTTIRKIYRNWTPMQSLGK